MKTRYVYFDPKTGVIKEILNKRKRGRAKYVISNDEVVGGIVAGTMGMMDLVVAYNRDQEEYVLLERDNIIKLRYYGKDLYKIPKRTIEDYDLRIDVFLGGNALEVSLDPERMSTMYSTDFREEVCFEAGTEIRIYIKDKEGNETLETIIIDAQELLENGQLFFELEDIDPSQVTFWTNRVFDKYMWRVGKTKFLSPMRDKIKFEVQRAHLKKQSPSFNYHLTVRETEDGLAIQNDIENIKLVKIFDEIEFFIVDRYDPTIMYDKFAIQPETFKHKEIEVVIKGGMKGKTILYNHKYISILIEGNSDE